MNQQTSGTCNGSACSFNYTEEQYVCTDGQTVYLRYHTTGTPSLANPPIQMTLPGTPPPPTSRPRYMESCPCHQHATSTATSTDRCIYISVVIAINTPLRYKTTNLIHLHDTRHRHQQFLWSPFSTLFDSQFLI